MVGRQAPTVFENVLLVLLHIEKAQAKPIQVEGRLDACWSNWFEGLEIQYAVDEETNLPLTILIGPLLDQSALHGFFKKSAA